MTACLIRLRPKSFAMLTLFVANAGRVLSKQELMQAVWANVHVAEDSLFQCIREIRTALGDDDRRLIELVSGRGYLFDAAVTQVARPSAGAAETVNAAPTGQAGRGDASSDASDPAAHAATTLKPSGTRFRCARPRRLRSLPSSGLRSRRASFGPTG